MHLIDIRQIVIELEHDICQTFIGLILQILKVNMIQLQADGEEEAKEKNAQNGKRIKIFNERSIFAA
ncbi:MAG: hypothetical protein ACLUOI_12255 [Eisenbergiella sp.]